MMKQFIEATESCIDDLRLARDAQAERVKELEGYKGLCLRAKRGANGKCYYSAHESSGKKHKYLGDDRNEDVRKIKELRFLEAYLDRIDNNIILLQNTLELIRHTDYDSVNESLPKTYKNPLVVGGGGFTQKAMLWKERANGIKERQGLFRPQDLKVRVNDGSMVRSKSEAMIYNYLLSVGATFAYELPI